MTRFSKIKVAYELSQLVTILALGCWPAGTRPIMFFCLVLVHVGA